MGLFPGVSFAAVSSFFGLRPWLVWCWGSLLPGAVSGLVLSWCKDTYLYGGNVGSRRQTNQGRKQDEPTAPSQPREEPPPTRAEPRLGQVGGGFGSAS